MAMRAVLLISCVVAAARALAPPHVVSRRALLRGAAASVVGIGAYPALAEEGEFARQGLTARPADLGSPGVSSYQAMKLDEAITELLAPTQAASGALKPSLEVFLNYLPFVKAGRVGEINSASLSAAADALTTLGSTSSESLQNQAASISKRTAALITQIKKADSKLAAEAALTLSSEVTDFAYEFSSSEKPLEALREAPSLYTPGKRIELPVSGKSL